MVLACGFTPLHLKTFLHAHLQEALPLRAVTLTEGLFGDLYGTLARAAAQPPQSVAIALEWSDIDPRLGYRSTAQWSPAAADDIMGVAETTLRRLRIGIGKIAKEVRIAISLPGLPLPPMFQTPGWQQSRCEIQLCRLIALFCGELATDRDAAFVNANRLTEESPLRGRFDLRSDLLFGFPYSLSHADCLAESLTRLLVPIPPRKGIITDLDDTLWNGIAGEVGPEGISWDLARHHHLHALYQNLLSSLADQGTLIGIASKNDADLVEKCFARPDILLRPEKVFPREVHWQAKSTSVTRILETWNVAADSVIFVDDSPMELAEVAAAHPGIQCVLFPKNDYAAAHRVLDQIRDLCAHERVSPEDLLRAASIRASAEFKQISGENAAPDAFLEGMRSVVTIDFGGGHEDGRVLELVNKTNQFNLNGIRRTAEDWRMLTLAEGSFTAVVTYEDKFGPLGRISIVQGSHSGGVMKIGTWVMSCRAFSRRIEHQCLRTLFERFDARKATFDFAPTARNGPLQELLVSLTGNLPQGTVSLARQEFLDRCPRLFHRVIVRSDGIQEEGLNG